LPGVHFRPVSFEPTFHKHAGLACGGCQVHVTDRAAFRPVLTAVSLIAAFHRAGPDRFAWREPPYEYEYTQVPIDVLYGSPRLREAIAAGVSAAAIAGEWTAALEAFTALRRRFLLYD
jgi:uncharacterized protein YbbC (DUF1343 family)